MTTQRPKRKVFLSAVALFVLLAVFEQLTSETLYYSHHTSATSTATPSKTLAGELTSTSRVERPLMRWVPFIKSGETVQFLSAQLPGGRGTIDITTRTHLLVIGLCSTAQYDRMADKYFEDARKLYLK